MTTTATDQSINLHDWYFALRRHWPMRESLRIARRMDLGSLSFRRLRELIGDGNLDWVLQSADPYGRIDIIAKTAKITPGERVRTREEIWRELQDDSQF